MELFIGADHNGFALKNKLRDWLQEEGHSVQDVGPAAYDEDDDYPDYGVQVARAVAEQPSDRLGILLCGSGVGMAIVADKVRGVRAGLIHDPRMAALARTDDNTNVLALGASFLTFEQAQEIVQAWLSTDFSGADRHERRIAKIAQYEHDHACPCAPPDEH